MIGDTNLLFLANTDVSAAAATTLVGDVIDLDVADSMQAQGNPFYLMIAVGAAFAGAGTTIFTLASDSTATIAVDGTATIHWQSQDFAIADLTAGSVIVVPLPAGIPVYERYLGLLVTGSGTTTAGSISAELVNDVQNYRALPDATN